MVAPRFTLRTGLVWLTIGSVIAVVLRSAAREEPWAIGVTVGLGSLALVLLIHALVFAAALLLDRSQSGDQQ